MSFVLYACVSSLPLDLVFARATVRIAFRCTWPTRRLQQTAPPSVDPVNNRVQLQSPRDRAREVLTLFPRACVSFALRLRSGRASGASCRRRLGCPPCPAPNSNAPHAGKRGNADRTRLGCVELRSVIATADTGLTGSPGGHQTKTSLPNSGRGSWVVLVSRARAAPGNAVRRGRNRPRFRAPWRGGRPTSSPTKVRINSSRGARGGAL